MYHLTVNEPFGKYNRGDHITDPAEVASVLAGGHAPSVVQRHPHDHHASGDFYRTDEELAERNAPAATPATSSRFARPMQSESKADE